MAYDDELIKVDAETHDADVAATGTKLIAEAFPAFVANELDTLEEAHEALVAVTGMNEIELAV